MKITSTRLATQADAQAIADVVNAHELSVDPATSVMSAESALDFMTGYVDPTGTHLLSMDGESGFSAVVNLHPDAVRARFFPDIYAMPHLTNVEDLALWTIELAEAEQPNWPMWPGVNFLDSRLQAGWAEHGFEFLRRYFTMRMPTSTVASIRQVTDVQIRAIDISDPDHVATWHALYQDSFSKHFGFAPRNIDKWRELIFGESSLDPNGVFVAFKNGIAVGYCQCNDEYAEEKKGQIASLGVAQEHQGTGIGEALLQVSITYCAAKGYETVELSVDTGNESGALKLYEKVGFTPESSWIQMHRPGDNFPKQGG